ncbi:MAG: PfkB domain protein [Firmicutes bacterium]|nr:PfkB domain protein [Bacillota bacterium]
MAKDLDVICVGAAIVDIPLQPVSKNIFDIESYPLNKIAMTIGGDAINEATIISRLGYKVALMSRVGKDVPGDFIINACKEDNIDIRSLHVDPDIDTSINVGLVTEDGERTFVTNRNGSLWRTTIEDVDFSRFHKARLLSMASIFNNPLINGPALVKIFQVARENNMIICADMIKSRLGEGLEDISEALSYLDYFFPNYDEACLLTGKTDLDDIAGVFLGCGVKNVVIKTGKKGCFIKNSRERYAVAAYKNAKAVDTIGAGDNFVAGFITAILDGLPLEDCGKFANVAASISVESVGATTGVQSRQQVNSRMREYLNS